MHCQEHSHVRYKWISDDGSFPEYEKLIPSEHNCLTHFDTTEAIRAVNSLKALSDGKSCPIDLTIADGKIVMANPDEQTFQTHFRILSFKRCGKAIVDHAGAYAVVKAPGFLLGSGDRKYARGV